MNTKTKATTGTIDEAIHDTAEKLEEVVQDSQAAKQPKQRPNNPYMLKVNQDDYEQCSDEMYRKLDGVFSKIDQSKPQTEKLFKGYWTWLESKEQREHQEKISELEEQLAMLKAKASA